MVTLISNISHYHYAAQALDEAGLLNRYVTSWAFPPEKALPWFLPKLYRSKLAGRRLIGVSADRVESLLVPEALQKVLPMSGLLSGDEANHFHNGMFDKSACKRLHGSKVVHFVNTLGVEVSKVARQRDLVSVCDSRQEHPLTQGAILAEEAGKRELAKSPQSERDTDRMLEELTRSDFLFVPSAFAKSSFVSHGFDAGRIAVVPYGVEPRVFSPKTHRASPELSILFVGQLSLRKGILYLLDALKTIPSRHYQLTCIGSIEPGLERHLAEYAGQFVHIPSVARQELEVYYHAADVFVLPSLSDAYPLVVLEALQCGLPVIITDRVGSCDLVGDGVNGFVVSAADSGQLRSAIEFMIEDPEARLAMHRENLALTRRIGWERYKADFIDAYASMVMAASDQPFPNRR